MSEHLDLAGSRPKVSTDREAWVRKVLGYERSRAMDALGVDIPATASVQGLAKSLTLEVDRLAAALARPSGVDVPGKKVLAGEIDRLRQRLGTNNPNLDDIRARLDQLTQEVNASVDAMVHEELLPERQRLVDAAARFVDELPHQDIADPAIFTPVTRARDAVAAAMSLDGLTQEMINEGASRLQTVEDQAKQARDTLDGLISRRTKASETRAKLGEALDGLGKQVTDVQALSDAQGKLNAADEKLPDGGKAKLGETQVAAHETAVNEAAQAVELARQAAEALLARVGEAGRRLDKVDTGLSELDKLATGVGAVDDARGKAGEARKAMPPGGKPVSEAQIKAFEDAVGLAEQALAPAIKAVQALKARHEQLGEALGNVKVPDGLLDDSAKAIDLAKGRAEEALKAKLSQEGLKVAEERIEDLRKLIKDAEDELAELGGADGVEALRKAFGAQADLDKVFGSRDRLRELTKSFGAAGLVDLAGKLGGNDPKAGAAPLLKLSDGFGKDELLGAVATVGGDRMAALAKAMDGKAVRALHDGLTPDLLKATMADPSDVKRPQEILKAFGDKPGALQELAEKGGLKGKPEAFGALLDRGCGGDAAKFATFCTGLDASTDLPSLKSLLDDGGLGAAPQSLGGLVGVGCAGKPADFKEMLAAFNSKEARDGLKQALTTGGLAGKTDGNTPPKTLIDPDCLGYLLKSGHKPSVPPEQPPDAKRRSTGLADLLKGLGEDDCAAMASVLEKGGLGAAPQAFAGMVGIGCDGSADNLGETLGQFNTPRGCEALSRGLTKGGLAGKTDGNAPPKTLIDPGCLGHLLKSGQPPQTPEPPIATRARGLDKLLKGLDDGACGHMASVLEKGGLGRAPAGFAKMIGVACKGRPRELGTVLTAFDDPAGQQALTWAVDKGGLAGRNAPDTGETLIDPACLAHMLTSGHKEVLPVPPKTGAPPQPDLAARCGSMKTLLTNMRGKPSPADSNFLALLEKGKGGLGMEPDRLGHVVGLGCEGNADKVADLGAKFNSDEKRAGLRKLLGNAGFGAKKTDGSDSKTSPECLGRLLGTGCEGRADYLETLTSSLGDQDRVNLEGVMSAGELGRHPKVLAKAYKFGCLSNPNDPANFNGQAAADKGQKNPQVLKDFATAFSGNAGNAAFKKLLVDGGVKDKENRLGSLLRYGCTAKATNLNPNPTQTPQKLRGMQTAFDSDMGAFKKMMQMFEGAPDYIVEANPIDPNATGSSNQPGKSLQNIGNSPHFRGGSFPGQLKTKFYDRLTAGATPTAPNPAYGVPARLSAKKLIRNAGSFEHAYQDPNEETRCHNKDARTGHVKVRHTRKFSDVTPTTSPTGHGNKSTLYPRVKKTNANPTGNVSTDVQERVSGALVNMAGNAPANANQIYNWAGQGFYQTYGWPDGKGVTTQIGFRACTGNVAKVTQFVPEDGNPECVTIHYNDMQLVNQALT